MRGGSQYTALPLAELGEAANSGPCGPDPGAGAHTVLWPPMSGESEDPPATSNTPRFLVRMGSAMTGSEVSLPGTRSKEQRRQEWLNSELLDAVLGGQQDKVTKLLEQGAEASAVCSPTRTSALHLTAFWPGVKADGVAVARLLLKHGADLSHRDHCDRTILHLAAWTGSADLLEEVLNRESCSHSLLDVQARPARAVDEREPFPARWKDSWSHAHSVVACKLPDLRQGSTALHTACRRTHLRCIELLTAAGANLSLRDDRGLTATEVLHEDPGDGELEHFSDQEPIEGRPSWLGPPEPAAPAMRSIVFQPAVSEILGPPGYGDGKGLSPEGSPVGSPGGSPVRRPRATSAGLGALGPGETAEERLLAGINCLKKAGSNFTPGAILHTALLQGSLQAVSLLLDLDKEAVLSHNKDGETPVHTAIKVRNMDALLLMLEKSEKALNVRSGSGQTPLMTAVLTRWDEAVMQLLLANADVTARDVEGATVLHVAADCAEISLLKELLSIPESLQVLEFQRDDGKTPLFLAVESSSTDRVQLFLEAGANLWHTLDSGENMMHRAVTRQDEAMVALLVDRLSLSGPGGPGGQRGSGSSGSLLLDAVPFVSPRLAPLHLAAKEGNVHIAHLLLRTGCNPCVRAPEDHHQTALHIAAREGFSDVVQLLLEHHGNLLHEEDNRRWRPVHTAAHHAQRDVLRILIKRGADLATEVRYDKDNRVCSALSLLVHSVANPVDFLEDLLDSSIALNEYTVSDQRAVITVDYSILIPEGPKHHSDGPQPQMRVIDAIVESGNYFGQQHLLQHPLIESFMTLKWKKMAPFFYAILVLHVLFVGMLTSLVAQIYWWAGDQGAGVQFARVGVFFTTVIIALQELLNLIQLKKMYIMDPESWLKWTAILLSLIVASVVFEGVEQQPVEGGGTGVGGGVPGPGPSPRSAAVRLGDRWERHVTTLAVLTAYTELLLLLCRFPRWGLRVLMFYKVAINVIKMLLTFSFLIVGFALSFFVQFRGEEPFPTLMESLGKTFVMGTSEFDYGDIFAGSNDTAVGRVLFFLFVLLVPVVLMNLLVGLAVSDIATLETKGRKRGLVKQAEFLSTLERLVYSQSVRWCMPSKIRDGLPIYLPVDRVHKIYPGKSLSIIFEVFPDTIRNEIVAVAMQNATHKYDHSLDDCHTKVTPRKRTISFGMSKTTAHADDVADTKLLQELAQLRREIVTRRELHDASERHERHFRTVQRQLEAVRARVEDTFNSLARPGRPPNQSTNSTACTGPHNQDQ